MRYCIILILCCMWFLASSQELWTLEKCIDHAVQNNLQVRQALNTVALAKRNYLVTKSEFLPSLNASSNTGYNWGKNFDSNTFLFTEERTSSAAYTISSSMDLFSGFKKINTLRQKGQEFERSKSNYQRSLNTISMEIATAYIKILYETDQVENARKQLNVTQLQLERTQKLVEAGSLPNGELFNMQAQVASEELNLINSQNLLESDYLNLMQLLDIEPDQNFNISKPNIGEISTEKYPISADMVFAVARDSMPEISYAKAELKIANLNKKISLGNYSPSLTGTGYIRSSTASSYTTDFSTQIDDNRRDYLGLTINIPIFNNLKSNYGLTAASIDAANKELALEIAYNNLRKEIRRAYQEMLASQRKYNAVNKQRQALEEAFKYASQKHQVGIITTVDFLDAKNKFSKAESDFIQAKYDFVFKTKVLDFYRGKPLTLGN
ncbi:TolC family protein [bacterium AH-315-C07]|nr:TolC family protein [bacterium AH-315-C07]